MPSAQGRDWSDLIRRLESAADQFPEPDQFLHPETRGDRIAHAVPKSIGLIGW